MKDPLMSLPEMPPLPGEDVYYRLGIGQPCANWHPDGAGIVYWILGDDSAAAIAYPAGGAPTTLVEAIKMLFSGTYEQVIEYAIANGHPECDGPNLVSTLRCRMQDRQ